jgi:NAD-dependent dihydropyrimidine dehydrogenase PreA subunit
MSAQPSLEQAVLDVFANCTECRACQKVCPFLAKFGLPKELLATPS